MKLRLGPGSAGILLTPEEFDRITQYDNRYHYELVRGVLVVHAIPSEGQVDPNEELGFWLRLYQGQHPQGSALDLTLPERYVRTPDSRRLADRVIWAGLGRQPDPEVDTPTIAMEFVSAGRRNWLRDYEEKRREYMAAGVVEYWIIDRFRRTMTVYRRRGKKVDRHEIGERETYRSDLLPGFELPLARLLAIADRWRKRKPRK
ncbi:MAG: Uma2 family endonuclease [Planctomycetes bacterium]|nr:Uma2 family endonuclease [Planctomycetota bacterium]